MCRTLAAIISGLAALFAASESLQAADDLSIGGVTLGQPLAIAECRSSPPIAPADYVNGECASTEPDLDDPSIKLVWFEGRPPPIGFAMRVYISNGLVDSVSFETLGARDEADVLAALRKKYGQPQTLVRSVVQNAFGVRAVKYHAEWLSRRVFAEFDGIADRIDRGWVKVEPATNHFQQLEERKKFLHARPPL